MVAMTKLLWLALTATAAIIRRDAITVQNDITQKIAPQITRLNDHVQKFPDSGANGALAIQVDLKSTIATFQTAVSHVKEAGSFGTVSGTTIVASLQVLVPSFLATLANIKNQASAWDDVVDGKALVLGHLQGWRTAASRYFNAVVAAEPFLMKAGASVIQTQIIDALTSTIAAYSESSVLPAQL